MNTEINMICSLLALLQGLVTGTNLSPCLNYEVPELKEAAQSLTKYHQDVPVLEFPQSSSGLKRRKREWVIPPINFPENDRGPFPKQMEVKIKSSIAEENPVWYSITGEGADLPPKGLFTVDRSTGWLYASKPLDREKQDKYVLQAHAVSQDGSIKEQPMEIIIYVIDMNDNKPFFTQDQFLGSVPEASHIGFEIMTVTATDADDPNTDNADLKYSILSQIPAQPYPNMFTINPVSGAILVASEGLDREKYPEYTLEIQVADQKGDGFTAKGKAIITVTNSNDNAPQFHQNLYSVSVPENKVGALVVKLPVTDRDEPQSPAWAAKFRIVGNSGGFFNISTGPNKQEGIITTVKPLDFERNRRHILLVITENEVQFAKPLPTSTATVIVSVIDVNEAPVFDPERKMITIPEDQKVDSEVTVYTANDPDIAKTQKVTYCVGSDPADWLNVDKDTGLIRVKSPMDRESPLVKDGKYEALILATEYGVTPATGTGTLIISVEDVNDNAPTLNSESISFCHTDPQPVVLSITDKDGPLHSAPFHAEIMGDSKHHWEVTVISSGTAVMLMPITSLEEKNISVVLRVYDNASLYEDATISVQLNKNYCLPNIYFCVKH